MPYNNQKMEDRLPQVFQRLGQKVPRNNSHNHRPHHHDSQKGGMRIAKPLPKHNYSKSSFKQNENIDRATYHNAPLRYTPENGFTSYTDENTPASKITAPAAPVPPVTAYVSPSPSAPSTLPVPQNSVFSFISRESANNNNNVSSASNNNNNNNANGNSVISFVRHSPSGVSVYTPPPAPHFTYFNHGMEGALANNPNIHMLHQTQHTPSPAATPPFPIIDGVPAQAQVHVAQPDRGPSPPATYASNVTATAPNNHPTMGRRVINQQVPSHPQQQQQQAAYSTTAERQQEQEDQRNRRESPVSDMDIDRRVINERDQLAKSIKIIALAGKKGAKHARANDEEQDKEELDERDSSSVTERQVIVSTEDDISPARKRTRTSTPPSKSHDSSYPQRSTHYRSNSDDNDEISPFMRGEADRYIPDYNRRPPLRKFRQNIPLPPSANPSTARSSTSTKKHSADSGSNASNNGRQNQGDTKPKSLASYPPLDTPTNDRASNSGKVAKKQPTKKALGHKIITKESTVVKNKPAAAKNATQPEATKTTAVKAGTAAADAANVPDESKIKIKEEPMQEDSIPATSVATAATTAVVAVTNTVSKPVNNNIKPIKTEPNDDNRRELMHASHTVTADTPPAAPVVAAVVNAAATAAATLAATAAVAPVEQSHPIGVNENAQAAQQTGIVNTQVNASEQTNTAPTVVQQPARQPDAAIPPIDVNTDHFVIATAAGIAPNISNNNNDNTTTMSPSPPPPPPPQMSETSQAQPSTPAVPDSPLQKLNEMEARLQATRAAYLKNRRAREKQRLDQQRLRQLDIDDRDDIVMDIDVPAANTVAANAAATDNSITANDNVTAGTALAAVTDATSAVADDMAANIVAATVIAEANADADKTTEVDKSSATVAAQATDASLSSSNTNASNNNEVSQQTNTQQLLSPPLSHNDLNKQPAAPPVKKPTNNRTRLPSPWKAKMSDSGDIYYHNPVTGEETFARPT